ncbi:uncharacterized protein [Battus philenor]|uniref:uncharacterized protein n=1 Tax=Battus philenor TaxID=42288 RepID=UPI0035D0DE8E
MQAAPARYVSSSELYSADEVELLLEEIRELEPVSCRGEEVQDFEIAGSGCGAGGRSPAGTELTERSWDSHAQYSRAPPRSPRALAPLYCHLRHLRTARGAITLLVVVWSLGACGCVWAGAGLRAGQLPLAARVRLLHLAALSSLMLHALLLAMHVTRLADLLPIDWNKLGGCAGAWSALALAGGGALTLHAVLLAPGYRYAPRQLAHLLLAAAGLGLSGACLAAGLALGAVRHARAACAPGAGRDGSRRSSGAAYRAVPQPQPCTSRDHPL